MSFAKTLTRNEMKNIKAGAYMKCDGCQNSTCQGYVDECTEEAAYQMCGPGEAGSPGPAPSTCVEVK